MHSFLSFFWVCFSRHARKYGLQRFQTTDILCVLSPLLTVPRNFALPATT